MTPFPNNPIRRYQIPIQYKVLKAPQTQSPISRGTVPIPFIPSPNTNLNLIKKSPILNLKRLPNPRRKFHRVLNQLSLLAHLHINLLLRILAPNMRHINRDQDIRAIALQPDQREDYSCEIRVLGARLGGWCLCGDERVGRDVIAVMGEMNEHVIKLRNSK